MNLIKKIEDNCYCIAGLLALGNDMSEKDMQAIQEYNLDNLKNIVKLKQMSCETCKIRKNDCKIQFHLDVKKDYCSKWESKDENS